MLQKFYIPEIMKKLLVFPVLLITYLTVGQVGIGTTSPNSDAILDITSTTSGLLLPRLALSDTTNSSPLSTDVAGMLVYNTATAGNVTPGFYVNDGTDWVRLGSSSSTGWSLTGNTGTTAGTNFIGTTDTQNLIIKTDNIERLRIDTDGHIRATTTVGGNTPSYSWQGDVDTGMRRNGSDDMSLMAGDTGLVRLVESGSGNTVSVEAGTSVDTDFSINSQTQTGMFFADASTNRVGIGTTTPQNTLHLDGSSAGLQTIRIDDCAVTSAGTNSGELATTNSTSNKALYSDVNGDVQVRYVLGDNIQSVTLSGADQNINNTNLRDINGATITFTPRHSTVYLSFAISGYNPLSGGSGADQQSWFSVGVTNGGTNVANFLSMSASADDTLGATGAATITAANYPISVTPGVSVTIKLRGRDGGNNHQSGFTIDKTNYTSYMTILD